MTSKEYTKLNKILETYLDRFLQDALSAGVDTSSKDFGKVLDREKKKIIENNGFTIEEFDVMEEAQGGKDLADSMEGMANLLSKEGKKNLEKIVEDFDSKIRSINQQIENASKELQNLPYAIEYQNLRNTPNIPKQFKQEDIKNLKSSQLQDYEELTGKLDSLKKYGEELKNSLESIKSSLITKHSQLQGIGPDDHHKESHTIESHIGVEITTEQLNKLVSGENVDDLHKHAMPVGGFEGGSGIPVPYFADEEVPSGTINGVNKTFTLANPPYPLKSLQLQLNGQYQTSGGVDFTLSKKTITFVNAPPTGSGLVAHYRYE